MDGILLHDTTIAVITSKQACQEPYTRPPNPGPAIETTTTMNTVAMKLNLQAGARYGERHNIVVPARYSDNRIGPRNPTPINAEKNME
ncbi:MAG TPA: hypothetical protein PLZ61_06140, partial [Candidatus Cryosericum sp.]|nr:hypothetical protein [Candidatus Cryosericum sp.]